MSDMKKHPRVSIVTRTKNRPALLGRAIESALGQTLKSWEMNRHFSVEIALVGLA